MSYWITCTPVSFSGDESHFSRDTGLLCRGFQRAGCMSKVVMPGPAREDDQSDVIRTDFANLEDAEWWRTLKADGVVLYAWGLPRYTAIARAIKTAGCTLVLNLDTAGLMTPFVETKNFWRGVLDSSIQRRGPAGGRVLAVCRMLKASLPLLMDLPRLRHLQFADIIGAVSPIALDRIRRYAFLYGFKATASRIRLIVHPVSPDIQYGGVQKQKQLIAIGRWTRADWVKNPTLLIESLGMALERHQDYEAVIIGAYDDSVTAMLDRMPPATSSRIHISGRVPLNEIIDYLRRTRISICTSRSESFHIASAEALCAGSSIVGYRSPFLPALEYFASENSGSLGASATPDSIASAISSEIRAWEAGERDPVAISTVWGERLHADKVAARILSLATETKQGIPAHT